jgi:hypothetical protein
MSSSVRRETREILRDWPINHLQNIINSQYMPDWYREPRWLQVGSIIHHLIMGSYE